MVLKILDLNFDDGFYDKLVVDFSQEILQKSFIYFYCNFAIFHTFSYSREIIKIYIII